MRTRSFVIMLVLVLCGGIIITSSADAKKKKKITSTQVKKTFLKIDKKIIKQPYIDLDIYTQGTRIRSKIDTPQKIIYAQYADGEAYVTPTVRYLRLNNATCFTQTTPPPEFSFQGFVEAMTLTGNVPINKKARVQTLTKKRIIYKQNKTRTIIKLSRKGLPKRVSAGKNNVMIYNFAPFNPVLTLPAGDSVCAN